MQEQEEDAAQRLDAEEEEALFASRRVFDCETGEVNFRKKRVTDMVTCKRITVPFAAEASKEAKIQVLVALLLGAIVLIGMKYEL